MRNERGSVRSDIAHISMCMLSGISDDEVPERVVGARGLRVAAIGLHLHRVDQVGKLDRVLDEEHRDVVADQVEVAFLRVELDREAADVARRVARAGAAGHGREADEDRRLLLRILQERRPRERAPSTCRPGSSRARRCRGRARCARECARDRSG